MVAVLRLSLSLLFLFCGFCGHAQEEEEDGMIRTTDGHILHTRKGFVADCKKAYGKAAADPLVKNVCECQADLMNNHFSSRQLGFHQQRYKEKALLYLIDHDPALKKQLLDCSAPAKHLLLVSVPSTRAQRIKDCIDQIKRKSEKPLNDTLVKPLVKRYCSCATDILQNRKITNERLDDLADPTSFLYNEIAFQCASPYEKPSEQIRDWKPGDSADIMGALGVDSVSVISVMGMHKVKITIGGTTKIWMIDSGASDLLISEEYTKQLMEKGLLSEAAFLGEGEYSLADNSIIKCRRYKIDGIQIGRYQLNNVVIASSKSAKEFLLGKSLLNKFSLWSLDNKNRVLILKK